MVTSVYMDNNATTKPADEVIEAMLPYLKELYANPSSMHRAGAGAMKAVDVARRELADLLGADPVEIVFTAGGTESDNYAIRGILDASPDKKHVITTRVEHPAVLGVCQWLARRGYDITFLSVDKEGRLDMDEYHEAFRPDTALVTVMWANNETGVIFPVERMAEIARARGVPFHTDAVQAVGKVPIDMATNAIDLLSLSGHKLHAPKGIGALYIRRGTRLRPLLIGGHQERNRRPGTHNVPGIVALGKAATLAKQHLAEEVVQLAAMRDRLEKGLVEAIPRAKVNGDVEHRLPNTSSISFEFIEGEAILLRINEFGIAASSGSACTSGSLEPSHVLRAMGIPFTMVHGSVRFSLSRYTTQEEVDYVIDTFPGIVADLRAISPYWSDDMADGSMDSYPLAT